MARPVPLLLIANFPDRVGGGEESFLALIREINPERFAPHAVTPAEGEISTALRDLGIPVTILPVPPVRPWTALRSTQSLLRLRSLLVARGIKLVHAHGSRGALYANMATLWLHVPIIWHVRIVDRDPWLDRILLSLSSAVIANSRATAGRFAGLVGGSRKPRVIHNGVDLDHFRPRAPDPEVRRALGLPSNSPIITFAGRLEYVKGPDLFLDAALQVHQSYRHGTYLFVGDGPMRPELEAKAKAARLPAVFVGRQPDLLPVLTISAVIIVPSRQEGFGRVLIEAMAVGVPVVATKVGGIQEVCLDGRTALLVPSEDPAALAVAILNTLTDTQATQLRVRAALEDVRSRFSLTGHVEKVCQLYSELLSR